MEPRAQRTEASPPTTGERTRFEAEALSQISIVLQQFASLRETHKTGYLMINVNSGTAIPVFG